ncbi:PAS domain S-box-containing protein [Nocardioides ginsengisegetis]|uniref:histidine kinase n=1 Tax=Nocardioides ginsengisegetis TaxID=661491 RepID=A0A7W3J475_9ACTN|nr:ATP-binding protein [Nocardioides ginsengisegetis]MBA8805943.1 PAS domain S-box-containing protein [Nocardioides ginsengisegetis]
MGSPATLATQRRRFAVAAPSALALVALFAFLLQPGFSLATRQAASGAGLLLAGVLGAVSCGARAAQTAGRRRRSWLLLMSAGCTAVAANLWATVVGADVVTSPSAVSNAGIALALALSIAGLLMFPSVRRRGADALVMFLDGAIAAGAVLVICSVLVYSELLEATASSPSQRWSDLLFPVLDIVLATVAMLLVLRTRGADRPALAMVAAGFLLYTVADLAFAVLAAKGTFEWGSYVDLLWIGGYLVISLAAWYPSEHADAASPGANGPGSDARATVLVFAVLFVAGVIQVSVRGDHLRATEAVLWIALFLAAAARQTLLAADNAALRVDLERRVRAQTADLRRLARQNEVLLTSVGDGIYGVDPAGRVTFVNPAGAALLGHSPDDLLGKVAHDHFHAPAVDGTPYPSDGCYISQAIRSGTVAQPEEDVYLRADGQTFAVEITASPLLDDDTVRGAVVVFRDVTQRREVERMKNEFLSVVSHELRTPLTSIRGSLGLLAGGSLGELPERAGPLVTIALQSSERLTRLINDLLDIERIESGTRPMTVAVLEAADLVATAAHQIEGLATQMRVRIEVGDTSGRVLADEDRIIQTLTNLLGNAITYSEPGGVVHLEAREQGGEVVFTVRDQGRGIPAEKLESIFEPFEQVDSSDARQKGGTGLGLAISRGIVEGHGGRIWAANAPGRGAVLTFTLPSPRRSGAEPGAAARRSSRPTA